VLAVMLLAMVPAPLAVHAAMDLIGFEWPLEHVQDLALVLDHRLDWNVGQ
jgi:hypothetical protein